MLEKKVLGIIKTLDEGFTIDYICALTNEEKSVILRIAEKLVKDNKAQWKTENNKQKPH